MKGLAIRLQTLPLGLLGLRHQLDGAGGALLNYLMRPLSRQLGDAEQDRGACIIVKSK
jgi:hypothetical protein